MCGIAGKVSFQSNQQDREKVLGRMVESLRRRGPDGSGIVSSGAITLGHTRLAIIDLSDHAAQPMQDETSRYWIVFNGEIYNYRELRQDLQREGYSFFSDSDTEVLLKAYMHWGTHCFAKFNGMFAVAIWDSKEEILVLARDRFGKKPLCYYRFPDGSISFASTVAALRSDPDIPSALSPEAMNCFLALGYILAPLTVLDGAKKLEPSHFMAIDFKSGKIRKEKYWDYAHYFSVKRGAKEAEVAAVVRDLIRQAVRRRMISDVPLGVFLSGGVDSGAVAKGAAEVDAKIMAFSMGFSDRMYNELPYAKRLADDLGITRHFCMELPLQDSPAEMETMFEAFDEPFSDTSLIPTMALAEFTRKRITVALSGDGGDEIFGGYVTYIADAFAGKYRVLPGGIRSFLAQTSRSLPVSLNRKVGLDFKVKQFLQGAVHDGAMAHYSWRLIFTPEERVKILGAQNRALVFDTDPSRAFKAYYDDVSHAETLDRHLYVDAKTWLADDILVKLDRSAMFRGLETRCPFLDNDLVEYMAGVPSTMKVKRFQLKYIFKKALQGYLPDWVMARKKSGFNAPVSRWLEASYKGRPHDSLWLKNEHSYFMSHVYDRYAGKQMERP